MGDGRYYTLVQFGNTIWLTLLILTIVPTIVISFYKTTRYKWSITLAGALLGMAFLCHFIAEIIDLKSSIPFFHTLKNIFLTTYILLGVYYLIFIAVKRIKIDKSIARVVFVLFISAVIITALIPQGWWTAYALFVTQYILLSNQLMLYSLGVDLFSNIKDMVLDYVFVSDIDGKLLFSSESVSKSNVFTAKSKINTANIEAFFNEAVTIKRQFGKQFIRLNADHKRYFQLYKKEIYSNEDVVGYIFTFVDVSQLISMLDEYDAKREVVFKSNVRLRRYKDSVYEIEREKEVNRLFLEIAQNQEKSLTELNAKIKMLNIDAPAFDFNIDQIIDSAKANLQDVRMAVSAYKTYYEEG